MLSMSTTQDGVVVALGGSASTDDQAVLDRLAVCVTTALGGDRIPGSKWEMGRAVPARLAAHHNIGW